MASENDEGGAPARPLAQGERKALSARAMARLAAVQALYQMDVARTDARVVIEEFTRHRFHSEAEKAYYERADETFFSELVLGVVEKQRDVDPLIGAHLAKGWRLARIDSILRAILRAASFELQERRDVPVKVIINEYVDIAHAFFGGDEPGVVNGILDAVARDVRAGDLKDAAHG
jgi:transcription antitermination protein NusB